MRNDNKNKDIYDKSDWYFTKAVSILIAVITAVTVVLKGAPFECVSLLPRDTIFLQPPLKTLTGQFSLVFSAVMGIIVCLEAISIFFLYRTKAKASVVCDAVSGTAGFIAFTSLVLFLLRYAVRPSNRGFDFIIFVIAGLWFLCLGIASVTRAAKNKVKLSTGYYVPAVIGAVLVFAVLLTQIPIIKAPTGFDAYRADSFDYDPGAVFQSCNYLRGGACIDDELIFVKKLSEEEYGLVRMNGSGDIEILDTAPFISSENLVVNNEYIYYLKNTALGEDGYVGGIICVMDIKTDDISEVALSSLSGDPGYRINQAGLIGIRDERLFLATISEDNNLGLEICTIDLKNAQIDPSSLKRYAWDLKYQGSNNIDKIYDRLYNGFIVEYSDFFHPVYNGYRYECDLSYRRGLEGYIQDDHGIWVAPFELWVGFVPDYNVYDGMLNYVRYDSDNREFLVYRGESISTAECIATVPASEALDSDNRKARLLAADSFLALVVGEDVTIIQL